MTRDFLIMKLRVIRSYSWCIIQRYQFLADKSQFAILTWRLTFEWSQNIMIVIQLKRPFILLAWIGNIMIYFMKKLTYQKVIGISKMHRDRLCIISARTIGVIDATYYSFSKTIKFDCLTHLSEKWYRTSNLFLLVKKELI